MRDKGKKKTWRKKYKWREGRRVKMEKEREEKREMEKGGKESW